MRVSIIYYERFVIIVGKKYDIDVMRRYIIKLGNIRYLLNI